VPEQQTQRRLAAVLAADVAGYTRLMRMDEEGTIHTWWSYRQDIIDPTIEKFSGRIVKLTGDGFLAEFSSATNAVLAAHAIQATIAPKVKDIPEEKRMQFRMGVNLGDIFWDDEDIYGDDVNIAARLEGLADPGSILISKAVFDNVKRIAQLTFENKGEQILKNISEPVQAYRVIGEHWNHSCISGDPEFISSQHQEIINPNSLAVLPFAVFGDDSEQEYFADGFTDDLITELARFSELFVTSRNASFALKGRNLDLREVGKQLGVAYCLEGSVRKMGERIRITCQLINTRTGDHVWAEKYDRNLTELFDVQDDLARSIVSMVAGRMERETLVAAKKKKPADMYAYEFLLRGLEFHRLGGVTQEAAEQALYWFDMAIEKDPEYGRAYAWRACAVSTLAEWTGNDCYDDAVASGRRAIELDEHEAECHRIMGSISLYAREFEKANYHFQRALELNPNSAWIVGRLGELHNFLGEGEKALEYQNRAKKLDPLLPSYCRELEAVAHYGLGNYNDTVNVVSQLLHKSQRCHVYLVAALSHLNNETALRKAVEELLISNPNFSISNFLKNEYYRDDDIPRQLSEDFKKAGMPDKVAA
jgi:adenylate cyclase